MALARYPGHPIPDQGERPSHRGYDTIIPEAAFDHRRYGHAPDMASDPAASASSSRPDQGTSSNLAAPDEALNVARSGCTPMNTITSSSSYMIATRKDTPIFAPSRRASKAMALEASSTPENLQHAIEAVYRDIRSPLRYNLCHHI